MPVYLFTFHAYRTWMPDRPQGYVVRGQGILPPSQEAADEYRRRAKKDLLYFDASMGWAMIEESAALCEHETWTLYETTADKTHVHVMLGRRTAAKRDAVAKRLKQRLGRALSIAMKARGPWFSRGKSGKRVRDRAHFDRLMKIYLPKHGPIRYSLRDRRPP
jgi:hypothetical protein